MNRADGLGQLSTNTGVLSLVDGRGQALILLLTEVRGLVLHADGKVEHRERKKGLIRT